MKTSRTPRKGQKLDTTPRLPAFKFSTRNKTEAAFRDRQKVLREKFGVAFTFRANAKLTGQRKAAITRRLNKYAEFLNPENQFRFIPLTPAKLKKVSHRREISSAQRTKTGIFVPVPLSRRKKATVRVDKEGRVTVKTGNFKSTFKKYRSRDVVTNPERIIADAKKRGAESIFVSIKGHRGGELKYGYSLKSFMHYLTNETNGLLQDVELGIEEPEEYRRKYPTRGTSVFKNWFSVEFVSHDWKKPKTTKKRK